MTALLIVAPTDSQLSYIKSLCEERGFPMPAVYSKQHASILIDELRNRTYYVPEWRGEETDADREAEWFERMRHEDIAAPEHPF